MGAAYLHERYRVFTVLLYRVFTVLLYRVFTVYSTTI